MQFDCRQLGHNNNNMEIYNAHKVKHAWIRGAECEVTVNVFTSKFCSRQRNVPFADLT